MKTRNKLGYGIGDMGAGILWGMAGSYIMVYMTDAVGMSAAVLGTMVLIARIFDGVSDSFMGTIIDNTHTKLGKARPWFLVSIVPLILTTVLLFNVPADISEIGKRVYFFVMYFAMTAVFYTINSVSYNALPVLATDNTKDRIGMTIIRFLLSISTGIIIGVITVPMLTSMGGLNNQAAWTKLIFVYAMIAMVTLTISGLSVREMVTTEKDKTEKNKEKKIPFYRAFELTFKNKYFLIMLVSTLVGMTRMGLAGASVYFAQYNLGNPNLVGILTIASYLPMILGIVLSPLLIGKIGMQRTRNIGNIISLIGAVLAAILSNNFTMVLFGIGLIALGNGPSAASNTALLAHVVDYGEWKHKERLAGTTFSCNSVSTKVGTGIGAALIGWGLSFGGYIAASPSQSASTLLAIRSLYLYIPVGLCLITFILNFFMDIEKKMPEIKKELAARDIVLEEIKL